MTLRTAHRTSAFIIGVFIVPHLLNHAALVGGVGLHIRLREAMRSVYRLPPVEILLLAAIAFQIISGARFLASRFRGKKDRWLWIQMVSGAYLVYFFINHIGATLFTRWSLGLDTNIYFASVGFHVSPFQFFFYPYYFLAVTAFFAHVAYAAHSAQQRATGPVRLARLPSGLMALGPTLGAWIVASQAGVFHAMVIPPEYRAAFENVFR